MFRFFKTPYLFKILFLKRIWGFYNSKKSIYLTFDDGPHPDITPWILDYLLSENIKATFFCVGNNVKKYPEIYQRILREGHAVGNHSMHHNNALKTSYNTYLNSIDEASKLIQTNLFRPPYGRLPIAWEKTILEKYQIIMWSWLSYDYDHQISISQILNKAKEIKTGDILVLHDNPKITAKQKELLPQLIQLLKEKKLTFEIIPCYEQNKNQRI